MIKTVVTLDKGNQPYGFAQLDAGGKLPSSLLSTATASYALYALSGQFDLQSVTTVGNQTSVSVFITGSLANGENVAANGDYSHAEGLYTQANGNYSHAEGIWNLANGEGSHAEGIWTQANGTGSHAEGEHTQAGGSYSHAEGYYTSASGSYSHAEGYYAQAYGIASHAEARYTIAIGDHSHSEGVGTQANGDASHAEGDSTQANGEASHSEGLETVAIGYASHAEGDLAKSLDDYAHSEGFATTAAGNSSHAQGWLSTAGTPYFNANVTAGVVTCSVDLPIDLYGPKKVVLFESAGIPMDPNFGYSQYTGKIYTFNTVDNTSSPTEIYIYLDDTTVSGFYYLSYPFAPYTNYYEWQAAMTNSNGTTGTDSHAEGEYTVAVGDGSHAEGRYTAATGLASHAEGSGSSAVGMNSHAEGFSTRAIGYASHAEGSGTQAYGIGSHAEGQDARTGVTTAYNSTSIVNGLITLDAAYGDITGFAVSADSYLVVYDKPFNNAVSNGLDTYKIDSVNFNGTATEIQLVDTNFNDTQVYVISAKHIYHSNGDRTIPADYTHAEGTNECVSIGIGSHAEGAGTLAIGYGSHSGGAETLAIGAFSNVEGFGAQAIGVYSRAEGDHSQAIGDYSHAEGASIASGSYSHAEGDNTQANGESSHAEGSYTLTLGYASHAEGYYTVASGSYQHVQGQYNISSSAQSAFIIGNGTGDLTRSNLVFASGSQFQVTGSVSITSMLTLATTDPLPGAGTPTGSIMVSGSDANNKPYYWNGATWTPLF